MTPRVARRLLLFVCFMAVPTTVIGQQTFEIKGVPLDPDEDGLVGWVDFRARATCAGADPGLQLAVDRIVVDGVKLGGSQYAGSNVPGISLPLEVSGGVLFLRGSVGSRETWFRANPGSIGADLGGFLDWITFADADVPDDWTCSDWTGFFAREAVGHRLEIHRTEGIGDRLFYRMKEAHESLGKAQTRLSELEARLNAAETSDDYIAFIRSAEAVAWPEGQRGDLMRDEAAGLLRLANARLEAARDLEAARQAEAQRADEQRDSGERTASGGASGGGGGTDSNDDDDADSASKEETSRAETSQPARTETDSERAIRTQAQNRVAHNAAMDNARAAEARGDRRTALRYYEEAQAYQPSEQLGRKIVSERGAITSGDLAVAVAGFFIDTRDPADVMTESFERQKAPGRALIHQLAQRERVQRDAVLEYTAKALLLLTDTTAQALGQVFQSYAAVLTPANLRQQHIRSRPSAVIDGIRKLPTNARPDSLFLFAFRAGSTISLMNERRRTAKVRDALDDLGLLTTDADIHSWFRPYEMRVSVTPIMRVPTDRVLAEVEARRLSGAALDDELLQSFKPMSLTRSYPLGPPVIVASRSRAEAQAILEGIAPPDDPTFELLEGRWGMTAGDDNVWLHTVDTRSLVTQREEAAYRAAMGQTNWQLPQKFLRDYPNSRYVRQVREHYNEIVRLQNRWLDLRATSDVYGIGSFMGALTMSTAAGTCLALFLLQEGCSKNLLITTAVGWAGGFYFTKKQRQVEAEMDAVAEERFRLKVSMNPLLDAGNGSVGIGLSLRF